MTAVSAARAVPGWYPDPAGAAALRYFDGAAWTVRVAPMPAAPRRRLGPAPAPAGRAARPFAARLGLALVAGGLAVLAWLGWELAGSQVYAEFAQRSAREALVDAAPVEQAAAPGVAAASPAPDLPAAASVTSAPPPSAPASPSADPVRPAPGEPVGTISFPTLGVSHVFFAGTDRATLKKGPGLWEAGVMPGVPGNATISGHRTTYGGPFRRLDALAVGDRVVVSVPGQPDAVFEVRAQTVVAPSQVSVTAPTGGVRLTLTTCDPVGSDARRLVVQAELVEGAHAADAVPASRWVPLG